ncbi:janus kinase and microtubule-interacting protein 3-like isoform X3 [Cataglyphis hispanica]|uniref:janus kinase and microtubule-interacting protein 3-like isoform X3 n=1 Tax=Cataglyphis hispanica TaxID=1086592 RepID=UPI00217FD271|nr:janus kinase and microtubule-interacting protein 3-like isoform X3 [Cataglyphis hispanica]
MKTTMASSSEEHTVKPTNTNKSTTTEIKLLAPMEGVRKRRRLESLTTNSEIPKKTQRRDEPCNSDLHEIPSEKKTEDIEARKVSSLPHLRKKLYRAIPANSQDIKTSRSCETVERSDVTRLRKTIQWLEEGARRLREDLANVRTELHEERRAAKIAKREFEAALREAKITEAAKYQPIIVELKNRIAHFVPQLSPSSLPSFKLDSVKDENHRREISTLRKTLAEAESKIQKFEWQFTKLRTNTTRSINSTSSYNNVRRLEAEIRTLHAENEKLEEKLRIALNAEKNRIVEIRVQRENHETELSALRKSLRSETIKMMDELRSKSREVEKMSKLLKRRKSVSMEHNMMRKLRENEKNRPIPSASYIKKKILTDNGHMVESYVHAVQSDKTINEIKVEHLRELALEQQEVIEILKQTIKERERKLEQLLNKKKKEEFYKQWLELEPVAEVDDEEDHEDDHDSALSSAPSSMSPQPEGYGQWLNNGITKEAYEAILIEIEELQSKFLREQRELSCAKIQICDLEKALLQERCVDRDKEVKELNDKLRAAEEREATLLVELSEIREQNELLEFRLLELEETTVRRDSSDHVMDSDIVSPESIYANKAHLTNQQRSRAVATVIPYTNNATLINPVKSASPVLLKPPLTLQESGIFEEEEHAHEDEKSLLEVELTNRSTQTDVPSGELLQEVQRLQELRARIQERAAKITTSIFHPIDSSKIYFDVSVDSMVQLTSYQERVRDLEERLEIYEKTERNREREKQLSKQREEELLDENYKLLEKIYWLENKLRNIPGSNFGEDGYQDGTSNMQQIKNINHNKYQVLETSENLENMQNWLKGTNCTRSTQTIKTWVNHMIQCQDQDNMENFDQQIALGAQCNVTEKKKEDKVEFPDLDEPVVINLTKSDSEKKKITANKRRPRSWKKIVEDEEMKGRRRRKVNQPQIYLTSLNIPFIHLRVSRKRQ